MTATPERDKGHSFERSNVGSRRGGDAPMVDQESGSRPWWTQIWTPRIESWAGQCNLSDVSLLAEDTARTGWLEWIGSLQFESSDMMDSCVDKAVK
ncbi:hypothetical protein YC2023_099174 [Brassica napus]